MRTLKFLIIIVILVGIRYFISDINQTVGFVFGTIGLGITLYYWKYRKRK